MPRTQSLRNWTTETGSVDRAHILWAGRLATQCRRPFYNCPVWFFYSPLFFMNSHTFFNHMIQGLGSKWQMLSCSESTHCHNLTKEFPALAAENWSDLSRAIDRSGAKADESPGCLDRRRPPRTVPRVHAVPKLLLTFFGNVFLGKAFKTWLLKGLLQPLPSYSIFSSLVQESNPCLPSHLLTPPRGLWSLLHWDLWEQGSAMWPRMDVGEITSSSARTPRSVTLMGPHENIGGSLVVRKCPKILCHS